MNPSAGGASLRAVHLGRLSLAALVVAAVLPASALAAPPANDARADATAIAALPSTQNGTTADASRVRAEHPGTRDSAPSASGFEQVVVT